MSGNWLELGLSKDEETIVRRAAQIYKTIYLTTIDNVFEVARALKILQDRHQMLGVRGTLVDALVQFGFTSRDGGPMNKALISHHKQLLENEQAVRAWWAKLDERTKRDWFSAKAVYTHWTASLQPKAAPRQPTPQATRPSNDAELARAQAEAKPAAAPTDTAKMAKLEARIAELEKLLAMARMASGGKMPETNAEWGAYWQAMGEVEEAKRAARKAAKLKAVKVELGETIETLSEKLRLRDQQLKGAQTRARKLNAEMRMLATRKGVLMSKALFRQIHKILHPDQAHNDSVENRRLTELAKEFNALKIVYPDA
jgi:hypothetical protein